MNTCFTLYGFILNKIQKFTLYVRGDTSRLRYIDEPVNVVQGKEIAFYCENCTKHTNTLCGQNAEFWSVQADSACGNCWSLKD